MGGGLVEIKCVKFNTHFERLVKGGFDTSYQWQIRGLMWVYDRPWCDFVSYCPDFPINKQLYVFRVERDLVIESAMTERLKQFKNQVEYFTTILNQ